MIAPQLDIDRAELAAFCRRHHIRRLSFFGSVVRGDFHSGSDVDVLAEFHPGRTPGFAIVEVEEELSRLLGGRKVDLLNPKYLNPLLKDRILAEAELQYAEG